MTGLKSTIIAIALSLILWLPNALPHEDENWTHSTGSTAFTELHPGPSGVQLWKLTDDRGWIAVLFIHGKLHMTKPYPSKSALILFLIKP